MNLAENCVLWRNKSVAHSKSRSLRSRENAKRKFFRILKLPLVGLAVTNQIINFHPFCLSKHAQGLLAFDGNVGQQLDGLLFGDADDLLGVVGFGRVAWKVKRFRAGVVVCHVLAGKQAQQIALGCWRVRIRIRIAKYAKPGLQLHRR